MGRRRRGYRRGTTWEEAGIDEHASRPPLDLVADARAIADDWLDAMDLAAMTAERLD